MGVRGKKVGNLWIVPVSKTRSNTRINLPKELVEQWGISDFVALKLDGDELIVKKVEVKV